MEFNDRRANKRALKAANGPSLAPKGYKPDNVSRSMINSVASIAPGSRKKAYELATGFHDKKGTVGMIMNEYKANRKGMK